MSDLHPLWQETDGDAVPVRVRETLPQTPKPEMQTTTISRKPAAIFGMLAVLGSGFLFFRGVDGLVTGQVAAPPESGPTVHITASGFSPKVVEVEHGQTITWVNDTAKQQVIQSKTLCSNTGFCLETKALAKDEKGAFSITPDIPAGSYAYGAPTDAGLKGTINLTTTATEKYVDVTSIAMNALAGKPPLNPEVSGLPPLPSTPNGDANPLNGDAGDIAQNPYTVGKEKAVPDTAEKQQTKADASQEKLKQKLQNGKGPKHSPQSGPGIWMTVILSGAVLWYSVRKSLRAIVRE